MSRFLIEDARIRYNPPQVAGEPIGYAIHADNSTAMVMGIISLKHWPHGDAEIQGCHFLKDESLLPGTMLIEPLDD